MGWDIEQSVALAKVLKQHKVDLINVSSGGMTPKASGAARTGLPDAFCGANPTGGEITTGAVGMITEPAQAQHVLSTGQADLVLLARELLREPYWPLKAAQELGDPISRAPPSASGASRQPGA